MSRPLDAATLAALREIEEAFGRRATPLADELARVLADEPAGASCDLLAIQLRRRRTDVLAALDQDPRFVHIGRGRGSRWLLEGASGAHGTDKDGIPAFPEPVEEGGS
jgi:hypothetical protein